MDQQKTCKSINRRKVTSIIALLLCMILAFGSTFAYLTDTTSKINTVTIGKVDIDVVEDLWSQLPDTDGDGIPDAAESVIPNQTVTKDPSIKNIGNNDAYVYLSVEVPNKYITSFNPDGTKVNNGNPADTDLFNYEINNGWTLIGSKSEAGKTIYTYGYENPLAPGAETPTLFDSVTVVNTNEGQGLEETLQKVIINGYAIQADNVGDTLNAWNIINNQAGLGTTAISNLLIPGPDFNATIPAAATKIAFVDDVAPAAYSFDNGKLLDVSDAQDKGVVSWYDEANTTYYVSTQRTGLEALSNKDSSNMFRGKTKLTSMEFDNYDTSIVENMSTMFYQCSGLKTLDLSNFNTLNVKNMPNMFRDCTSLENINLSSFNTKNVESFQSFFNNCGKLSSINFGNNFYTDNANSVGYFFMKCASLNHLDLSSWNTKKATQFKSMFNQCTSLTEVKFGKDFTTDSAENMSYMFYKCAKLTGLDLSSWNTKNVKQFEHMFEECRNIKNIKLGENFGTDSAVSMASMFCYCTQLTEIDVANFNVENVEDMSAAFCYCTSLKEIDVSNWNPKNCINMSWLCNECTSLETFDASGWTMSKAEELNSMFSNCANLEYFSTKDWIMNSAKNLRFMFYGCKSFKKLDCEDWNVSNVTTFDHFMAHSQMEEYDVSKWNITSKCQNLNAIFHSTRETYIDVTGWDTSNVIAFNQLCDGMWYLEKIDGLETWNTSNGVCFAEMFHGCGSLKEANLSSFDTRKANTGTQISTNGSLSYGLQDLFTGCGSLEKLILSKNFTRFGNGEIGESYYANFPTPASGYWYNAETGQAYAPNEIPDLTAATYVSTQP